MTSARRPAPGVRRWLHLLLGVLLVGATGAVGLTSSPALAAPLQTELRLTTLAPITVQAGGTLRTIGTFSTSRTLDDVVVRLEVGTTAFLSRAAITEAASTPPVTTPVFGATDELGKVRADSTRRFRIQVATDDLPFYGAGVFPLRVVAVDVQTGTVPQRDLHLPAVGPGRGGRLSEPTAHVLAGDRHTLRGCGRLRRPRRRPVCRWATQRPDPDGCRGARHLGRRPGRPRRRRHARQPRCPGVARHLPVRQRRPGGRAPALRRPGHGGHRCSRRATDAARRLGQGRQGLPTPRGAGTACRPRLAGRGSR